MPLTERAQRLKSRGVSKACQGGRYQGDVRPDIERAKLWTESYRMTEGEPEILRRAKALRHTLTNMTIYILEDELIVGNNTPSPHCLYLSPECNPGPIQEAIEDGFFPDKQDQETLQDIMDYWKGKNSKDWVESRLSDEEIRIIRDGSTAISITHLDGAQHCVPNWQYVNSEGTIAIQNRIRAKLETLPAGPARDLANSMLISIEGMNLWTKRYSELAKTQAEAEKDPHRADELRRISDIMAVVLTRPPESFHEAVQGFFVVHLILHYIDRAGFGSLNRVDQTWFPTFKSSIDSGKMTRDDALELLECLWIKMLDLGYWFPRMRRLHFDGNSLLQTLTLGGVKTDGTDACNELTEVVLDSVKATRNNQPTFNFRYHSDVSDSALTKAMEVIRSGMGMPAILSDKRMIHTLTDQGIPEEIARDWAVVGCVSACPVSVQVTTKRLAQSSIVAKCFELALNDGACILTGAQLGPHTGDPHKFQSYDEVKEAFRLQVKYAFELGIKVRNITRQFESQYQQRPLASALHVSPLDRGMDVSQYEDYPNNWINIVGLVDVTDSFAVLKKLVFEDNVLTLGDLIDIIHVDWKDNEVLRQKCINKVPKFGNDETFVDSIAHDIYTIVALEARKVKDIFNGGGYRILPQSVSLYVSSGKKVGALPNGRHAHDFLADGGASPQHGLDMHGPTAVLNSVSALPHELTKGILLNQRFMPSALEGDEGMARFKAYIKTWYERGGSQIQFNVVSTETLKEAQIYPDKHRDVIVRVAGYSAYFTQLSKPVQDAIINRKAQEF